MGVYTRLVLNVALTPVPALLETLQAMVKGGAPGEGRFPHMLRSSSYYHDAIQHASLEYDDISTAWKLSVTCDLKNYEDEIARFLTMIAPAVVTDELAGYFRYEESVMPTLFWFRDGAWTRTPPEE